MEHEIHIAVSAAEELAALKKFDQKRISAEIDRQLVHQPTVPTRNRKCLGEVETEFEYEPPLWELRVGEFRVFYHVNSGERRVNIRALRRKTQEQRTEDIIQ